MSDKNYGTINRFSSSMDFGSFGRGSGTKVEDTTKQDDKNKENNMSDHITFEQIKGLLEQQQKANDARFSSLEKNLDSKFNAIDQRFDKLETTNKNIICILSGGVSGEDISSPSLGVIQKIDSLETISKESSREISCEIKCVNEKLNSIKDEQTKTTTSINNFKWGFGALIGIVGSIFLFLNYQVNTAAKAINPTMNQPAKYTVEKK